MPKSFNPRARTGRDFAKMLISFWKIVSIHAPVRGATITIFTGIPVCSVSIHAPVRGATITILSGKTVFKVSIHAPVRGATVNMDPYAPDNKFQSTRPYGARLCKISVRKYRLGAFQSTRPYGARPMTLFGSVHRQTVSIHAPVRGATLSLGKRSSILPCFNPRARTGRDLDISPAYLELMPVSIHAPVRGATNPFQYKKHGLFVSIHAPRTGRDLPDAAITLSFRCFNPRAPYGARQSSCL